jgi:putative oxidoreductase
MLATPSASDSEEEPMSGLPLYPGYGIFIVRITMGALFAVHGYQKFAGGIGGVVSFFSKLGVPAPGVLAPFVAGLELVGGILLILGVATRWISALFACEMLVTTVFVQIPAKGWNGADLDRMLLAAALLFILAGPGALAVQGSSARNTDVAKSRSPER